MERPTDPSAAEAPPFTRDEVRRALELRLSPAEVDEAMEWIYTVGGGIEYVAYSYGLLDALATLSPDAASRVKQILAREEGGAN